MPQNIFAVSTCVFVTNCFDLLICTYGTQLFATAPVFSVAQGGQQLTFLSQAATKHPSPAVPSLYAVRINQIACLSAILVFNARNMVFVC